MSHNEYFGCDEKEKGKVLVSILIVAFENGKIIAEKPNLNEFSSFKKQNEAEIFLIADNSNIKIYKQFEILASMSQLADRDVYVIQNSAEKLLSRCEQLSYV